ncbi:Fe2+-dependent dioxygenase [soil metagenome]
MLVVVPDVLTGEVLQAFRTDFAKAAWGDGRVTAGHQSAKVKHNLQLAESDPMARRYGDVVLDLLSRHPLFLSAALPAKVFPPLFNCYRGGGHFGFHVDNAVRDVRGTPHRVRTDLSATLFISQPDEYDGGELEIDDTYGRQSIKLAAGSMVLYPGTSLHRVTPVTRGERIASFFWIQSLIRDDSKRSMLLEMDRAIQKLAADVPEHESVVQLTSVYHNLVRSWAEV